MQLTVLFALLPILAHAAPLAINLPGNIGVVNVPILGATSSVKLPVTPSVPALGNLPVSNLVGAATSIVAGAGSSSPTGIAGKVIVDAGAGIAAGAGVVVSAGQGIISSAAPAVDSAINRLPAPAKSVVQGAASSILSVAKDPAGIVASVTASLSATATAAAGVAGEAGKQGIKFVGDNLVGVDLNPGNANVNGTFGGAVAPITTELPSEVLTRLSTYVANLRPIDTADTVKELTGILSTGGTALKLYVENLKNNINYKELIIYLATLIKNINDYLNKLPGTIAADSQVIGAAGSLDGLLNTYLFAAKLAGVTTLDFANAMYKSGLLSSTQLSALLPSILAIFPDFPQVIATL